MSSFLSIINSTNLANAEQSVVYILLMLLCCIFIWSFFYSYLERVYSYMILALLGGICSTIMSGRIRLILVGIREIQTPIAYWYFPISFLILLACSLYHRNRYFRQRRITPMTIKESGDKLPAGVCYWKEGGRLILSNKKMEQLCIEITGNPLMNGDEFYQALEGRDMILLEDNVWRFSYRKIMLRGIPHYELIATDITKLYEETQKLEEKNRELTRMNESLRQYNEAIDEVVRQKEILNAKISIHDDMNRMMLTTVRSTENEDPENRQKILKEWQKMAHLLSWDTSTEQENNMLHDLCTYGELMGLEFVCNEIPAISHMEIRRFLARSAREIMNNAVKHGNATRLEAKITRQGNQILCEFRDNGKSSRLVGFEAMELLSEKNTQTGESGTVQPSGGLKSIQEAVAQLGGTIYWEKNDGFRVKIQVPDMNKSLEKYQGKEKEEGLLNNDAYR